jgi:hypothetical protein
MQKDEHEKQKRAALEKYARRCREIESKNDVARTIVYYYQKNLKDELPTYEFEALIDDAYRIWVSNPAPIRVVELAPIATQQETIPNVIRQEVAQPKKLTELEKLELCEQSPLLTLKERSEILPGFRDNLNQYPMLHANGRKKLDEIYDKRILKQIPGNI